MVKSEVVIRELAGQKRVLRLQGAGLPKQGANWGGHQRLATTWYPGNTANANQQVLGAVEIPTNWAGVWNTTRLYRSPCIFEPKPGQQIRLVFADGLREVLEDMVRGGTLLQVLWINSEAATFGGRSIQRIGRAADWNFVYARMDDIDWTITWEWTGRGLGQQRVTQFREDPTNSTSMALMSAITLAVDDAVNKTKIQLSKRTIPKSATKFSLEQLGAILDAPNKLMKDFSQAMNRISNRVTKLSELIDKVKGLPFELSSQAADIATGAVIAANHFYDSITQTPPELYDAQQHFSALVRTASYTKGGVDSANQVVATSYPIAASIRAQIDTRRASGEGGKALPTGPSIARLNGNRTQVQTYLVKTGDTLIGISQRFYGVPEGAYGIAFSNGLSLKVVTPPVGKVLIIPPLNGGPGSSKQLPIQQAGGQTVLPNGAGQQGGSP